MNDLRDSFSIVLGLLVMSMVALAPASVIAQQTTSDEDFDPASDSWTGLSRFIELADRQNVDLEIVDEINWSTQSPDELLIFVYPTNGLKIASAANFIVDGGGMLIADDFGQSPAFLDRLDVSRVNVGMGDLPHDRFVQQNRALPIFQPSGRHPLLDGVDIEAVAKLCKAAGAILVVDNVFATPILQKPLELGADVVVYSTTKHMDGQGRVMGGAILCDSARMEEIYDPWLRHLGPAASPFNAWVVLKGLETLKLRVDQQTKNAARLADIIADHPAIAAVRYPHREDHPHYDIHKRQMSAGGTMIAFSVKGGQEEAFKLLNSLELVDICNNLGDTKSLACHPSSTTYRALSDEEQASMGLDRSWIRMSVGLEDSDDLVMDLTRALNSV